MGDLTPKKSREVFGAGLGVCYLQTSIQLGLRGYDDSSHSPNPIPRHSIPILITINIAKMYRYL